MTLSARGRRLLVGGLAAFGFVFAAQIVVGHGIQGAGGLGGIDAIAYWSAAGRAWHGESLYHVSSFEFAAYQYPPPFAQLLAPFSLLPMPAFVWAWRAVELVCLRVAVGSWQRAGLALLLWPPIIAELDAGNIHLVMAAAAALAMRGIAGVIGPAFLLKFASWPLVPIGLILDRSRTLLGAGIALGVVAVSWILAPQAWHDYASFIARARAPEGWYNVLGGVPVLLRLGLAGVLGIASIRYVRVAPLAVTLAYPVVWYHGLATLVAVAAVVPARTRTPRLDDKAASA